MTEQPTQAKAWTFKQTLLLSILPIVLSNAGQWMATRAKSEVRDEHLLRAFTSSVDALDAAREVVENAEARLRACEARSKSKGTRREAPAPAPPVIMMREETGEDSQVMKTGNYLARGGDVFTRALRWLVTPSHATTVLDAIAQQEAK